MDSGASERGNVQSRYAYSQFSSWRDNEFLDILEGVKYRNVEFAGPHDFVNGAGRVTWKSPNSVASFKPFHVVARPIFVWPLTVNVEEMTQMWTETVYSNVGQLVPSFHCVGDVLARIGFRVRPSDIDSHFLVILRNSSEGSTHLNRRHGVQLKNRSRQLRSIQKPCSSKIRLNSSPRLPLNELRTTAMSCLPFC